MAHSADTDKYDDFGLSPLSQKAFSKSSLPRQPKAAGPAEEARASMNFGWLIRLFFGLVILGAGIFAVMTIAENRKNEPAIGEKEPKNTQAVAQAPALPVPDTTSGNSTAPTAADTVAWNELNSSPADIEAQQTRPTKPLKEPPVRKEVETPVLEAPVAAQGIKYYAIVGSFSDLEHAVESKQKLKIRTRVIEKDGKYRLVADSVISSKPAQLLIDSLKRKKPSWWLAKAN